MRIESDHDHHFSSMQQHIPNDKKKKKQPYNRNRCHVVSSSNQKPEMLSNALLKRTKK